MDITTVAQPRRPDTRELRALELFRTRGYEIERSALEVYRVPRCTGEGVYEVRYGGEVEHCTCPAFEFGHGLPCKHLLAVGIAHAKRRFTTVHTISIAGDPFHYADARDGCPRCFGGYVTITVEEDGVEHDELVPCRRCRA